MHTTFLSLLVVLDLFITVHAFNNSTTPFIFNDLYSLLTHWPNTFHPNGHSIIPGILAPFTLLYHARKDTKLPPPSPEWLAFDPEMSYAVMASKIAGPTYFLTYRTVKPARVVYFNGMSAAWGDGWLDTQYAIITGKGKANGTRGTDVSWWDDYGRAKRLCEWGKRRDVDGIVRMNAGFEIIWCDFESPKLQLVSSLNVTPPGTPRQQWYPFPPRNLLIQDANAYEDPPPPAEPPRRPPGPGGPGAGRKPPGGPGGPGGGGGGDRRPPWWFEPGPLALSGNLEWTRAAARRPTSPQPHLSLSYSDMVTFYHPRFESLVSSRVGKPMQEHVVWEHVSDEDVRGFVDELDGVLTRMRTRTDTNVQQRWGAGTGTGTGLDWQALAVDIVVYWADRIVQIEALLDRFNASSNASQVIETVQQLTYSPLDPYIDYGSALNLNLNLSARQVFFKYLSPTPIVPYGAMLGNGTAFERCMYSSTEFLANPEMQQVMTPQERVLRTSVECVLERLCRDFGILFSESSDMVKALSPSPSISVSFGRNRDAERAITSWRLRVRDLMSWLDWAAWLRCEEVCDSDSVCSMPLWPISWMDGPFGRPGRDRDPNGGGDSDSLKPSCKRLTISSYEGEWD